MSTPTLAATPVGPTPTDRRTAVDSLLGEIESRSHDVRAELDKALELEHELEALARIDARDLADAIELLGRIVDSKRFGAFK